MRGGGRRGCGFDNENLGQKTGRHDGSLCKGKTKACSPMGETAEYSGRPTGWLMEQNTNDLFFVNSPGSSGVMGNDCSELRAQNLVSVQRMIVLWLFGYFRKCFKCAVGSGLQMGESGDINSPHSHPR